MRVVAAEMEEEEALSVIIGNAKRGWLNRYGLRRRRETIERETGVNSAMKASAKTLQ